jgi:hypothetical protein
MTEARVSELVERAFEYRGYVTLRRHDGSELVGFVYERGASHLEIFDETATRRLTVPLEEIADIAFTGADAAQKSQEIWERRKGTLEPRDTPAWGDWRESGPVLVLVALGTELRSVARAVGTSPRDGRVRARIAGGDFVGRAIGVGGSSRAAVTEEEPRLVITCGFSGSLDSALEPGDLVLATSVRDENGDVLTASGPERVAAAAALRGLRFFEGELACTTAVAATPEEKRALARPGTLAVDMESHPAARAATEAGIPWIGLRAIVDPLESTLPQFTQEPEDRHLLSALKYALGGPRAVTELIQLASRARRASHALELALHRLTPLFAAAEAHP